MAEPASFVIIERLLTSDIGTPSWPLTFRIAGGTEGRCRKCMNQSFKPNYLPTVEKIAERFKQIQAGWSRMERRFRYLIARTLGSINELEPTYWSAPKMRCFG